MLSSARRMSARDSRERLIDEVKKCPVLYDTRHEHHRDTDVRDRCWTDIAAKLGANSEVLKREWKILRDSLRQSLRNSRATTKSGMPCKRWGLQSRMSFLLPYMTKRKPRYGLRDEIKSDLEQNLEVLPEPSEGEGGGGDDWASGGVLREEEPRGGEPAHDALELFFASVCASARRLPTTQQRQLKRQVLEALLRCEAEADGPAPPAPTAPTAPPGPSTYFTMNDFKH